MFNERKIQIFLHVAKTKNFSETGRQLFLSQQAVSKSISDFESDVGKKLFERKYRVLELTPDGKRCFQIMSRFMKSYEEFTQGNSSAKAQEIQIRVGYLKFCSYGAEYGRAFSRIREQYPNVRFTASTFTPEALIANLNSGTLDMVFTRDVLVPPNRQFCTREITRNRTYLAVSAQDKRINTSTSWETFSNDPFIVNAIEHETQEELLLRSHAEIDRLGLRSREIVVAPDRESAMHYAELGNGIISASESSQILRSPALHFFPTDFYDKTVCIWSDSEYTALINQCCSYLILEFSNEGSTD